MRHTICMPLRTTLLGSLLLASACVQAQDLKAIAANAKDRFAKADADHNGALTREEAQRGMPFVAKHFDQIDSNKAGHVSLEQVLRYVETYKPKKTEAPAKAAKPAKQT